MLGIECIQDVLMSGRRNNVTPLGIHMLQAVEVDITRFPFPVRISLEQLLDFWRTKKILYLCLDLGSLFVPT